MSMPILLIKVIVAILVVSILIYFVGKCLHYKIAIVDGESMYPTLKHKQHILVNSKVELKHLKSGNIYVYIPPNAPKENPEDFKVIKRLIKITPIPPRYLDSLYWFEGDNKDHSEDSRLYGYVTLKDIKYRVVYYKKHSK